MRVCQFRHDGKSDSVTRRPLQGHLSGENHKQYSTGASLAVKLRDQHDDTGLEPQKPEPYPSSFAVIVILALSTLDTGQPLFAFSAAFWKAASSAFGTRPTTSR